jgi:hypothetical protein
MPAINTVQGISTEIVLQERLTTTEFKITEIHESIQNRFVRVDVELGPFATTTRPNGETETRGSSRRGLIAWDNEDYDAIRDTWANADLLAVVKTKLEA